MSQDYHSLQTLAGAIRQSLARRLTPDRFTHVMGVEGMAVALAMQWGVDPVKVLLAALLHDYMKGAPREELRSALDAISDFPVTDEDRSTPNVWHGLAAAHVARERYGVTDRDVREAVFYHTTGVEGFGPVGLCLYVADTLEPTRHFPGVSEMRRLILGMNMQEAALQVSRVKLDLLLHKHGVVHSYTRKMNVWLSGQLDSKESGRKDH